MTTVSGPWATDERAARSANERLPEGYCILWTRDQAGRFCADGGIDGPDPERERVLRVLVESAREHAGIES